MTSIRPLSLTAIVPDIRLVPSAPKVSPNWSATVLMFITQFAKWELRIPGTVASEVGKATFSLNQTEGSLACANGREG